MHGNQLLSRAMDVQRTTQHAVQFEPTETHTAVAAWIAKAGFRSEDFLFPRAIAPSRHNPEQFCAERVGGGCQHPLGLDTALA